MIRLALCGNDRQIGDYLKLGPRLCGESNATLVKRSDLGNSNWDSDEFDAAVICSNLNHIQEPPGPFPHGKHVLLATRLTRPDDAGRLLEQGREHNVRVMAGRSHRFLPAMQAVKQSLDSGQLGDPGLVRVHRWQQDADPLADAALDIDLAIWMFQALPTEVYAPRPSEATAQNGYTQIHLGFPGGRMALIDLCGSLPSPAGYFSLSMIGSSGSAYADDHHNQQLLFRGEHPISLTTGDDDAARLAELQEFVDAVRQEREPAVTCADSRTALLVANAAADSGLEGRTARLVGDRYEF